MVAWLTSLLASIGTKWIWELFSKILDALKAYYADKERKKQETIDNKKATDDYLSVVADPNKTRQERKDAEDKYLNS